jgi:hypothetical protein
MTALQTLLASFIAAALLASAPAMAIYKCEAGGKTTYSDKPCPAGAKGSALDLPAANESAANAETAKVRAQKSELKRIDDEKRREEAVAEKTRAQALRAREREQKRCMALAQRRKWAEEDVASANQKTSDNAKKKARRLAERYDAECKKSSPLT